MSPLNFQHLECFVALAEELHFGRAAKRLGRAQSTVSAALTALERDLGAPLVERSTRQVALTKFGIEFLGEIRSPMQELRDTYNLALADHGNRIREIRIGHTPALGQLLLPDLLTRETSHAAEDAVPWKPVLMWSHESIQALMERRIDIGLCWVSTVEHPLIATPLGKCRFVAMLRDDDPLSAQPSLSLVDLRERLLVISSREASLFVYAQTLGALLQAGISPSSFDEVPEFSQLPLHVATESRVGVHPAVAVLANRIPGVVYRPLRDPNLEIQICAVHRKTEDRRIQTLLARLSRSATTNLKRIHDSLLDD
jgi:DNA-binding transcriptional LysR family regulator